MSDRRKCSLIMCVGVTGMSEISLQFLAGRPPLFLRGWETHIPHHLLVDEYAVHISVITHHPRLCRSSVVLWERRRALSAETFASGRLMLGSETKRESVIQPRFDGGGDKDLFLAFVSQANSTTPRYCIETVRRPPPYNGPRRFFFVCFF